MEVWTGWLVSSPTITERKKAEEDLKNQVFLMTSLLEAIPAPVFFKDTDHVYMGCNEALCTLLGAHERGHYRQIGF